jgi:hypothetical protein
MDKQSLLQLDAMVQQVLATVSNNKRNPQQPGTADLLDSIHTFIRSFLDNTPSNTPHQPWKGNA